MNTKSYEIHERIFNYIIDVIKFLNKVPKTSTDLIFIGQCTRSVTSIGTNDKKYALGGEKLISEANEIVAIVSTIIKNASNNEKARK